MTPTIVVIFQSRWFHADRPEILHLYADPVGWRNKIRLSKAGAVLERVFRDLYDQLIFRAANPYPEVDIDGVQNSSKGYSPRHIAEIFSEYAPDIVIALGDVAQHGVNNYLVSYPWRGPYLLARHPLDPGALITLVGLAAELRKEIEAYG